MKIRANGRGSLDGFMLELRGSGKMIDECDAVSDFTAIRQGRRQRLNDTFRQADF
jgi:hypothetical protein